MPTPAVKKSAAKPADTSVAVSSIASRNEYQFGIGDFVHVVMGGQTRHKGAEILWIDAGGLTIRTDVMSLTKAEVSFVPWSAVEGLGLIGKR